ncbi:MAG: sel1 repeat family protein, partial [Muribaculaceae bacterium]
SEAVRWYRKSAEQGFARGQYNLGHMYENGRGVGQNVEEAVRWYRKAAAQNYTLARDALTRLGR